MLTGLHASQWALCLCPLGGVVCVWGELTKLAPGPFSLLQSAGSVGPLSPLGPHPEWVLASELPGGGQPRRSRAEGKLPPPLASHPAWGGLSSSLSTVGSSGAILQKGKLSHSPVPSSVADLATLHDIASALVLQHVFTEHLPCVRHTKPSKTTCLPWRANMLVGETDTKNIHRGEG